MIRICSFFPLPAEERRIGPVYSIANSYPRTQVRVKGEIRCVMPPWKDVKAYKSRQIGEEEFTSRYRNHIEGNWQAVREWMDSLNPADELYLCCWERTGFCHRYLVAKLLQKFRPDLEVQVT